MKTHSLMSFGIVGLVAGCSGSPAGSPAAAPQAPSSAAQEAAPSPPSSEAPSSQDAACGPQAPRDISKSGGSNSLSVPSGPTPNLCNLHFHKPFEHAGFQGADAIAVSDNPERVCESVSVGDKLEFHWVHTNCELSEETKPGLDNCVCDRDDLVLRVLTQAYVVTEDGGQLEMPSGELVRYPGSTTGPSYSDNKCSAARVNWEVNPKVEPLSLRALADFCADNAWDESHPHDVRPLVQREDWLAPLTP